MRSSFWHYLTKKRIRNVLQVTWRRCYNVSGTAGTLLEEEFSTYQERLASYLKKMFQRIRNIWQVTWRRCYDVSGTSCKLLDEEFTTYQEHLASYLKKMLQRSRHVLHVTWRRYGNVSGMSCKLLQEDVTTYQERLASHLTKMLRRSMNVLPVCAQEHERYYPTPPHPTGNWSWQNSAVPVSAGQQERWWGCCACVCTGTWTLLPHPIPPHPTPPATDHERTAQCLCLQDSKQAMRLLCLCVRRNMNVITPPHPTPVTDHERAVQCLYLQDSKRDDEVAAPDPMSQPRVRKFCPKGIILWCSKWSTVLVL